MIRGVTVTVKAPVYGEPDRFGDLTKTYTESQVGNVLVSPGSTSLLDASRPEGARVAYTLHFPKTFTGSLEGCIVTLPSPWAGDYRVIGDPRPYIDANTPTEWHTPAEVEAAHG